MASQNLAAKKRSAVGKGVARKLRAAGEVPAVIYGHSRDSQALSLNTFNLTRLLDKHSFRTTVIDLDIEGTQARTLIREIQRHPYNRAILHVDFQELVAGEKVTVRVPLVMVGTPEGVRVGGGILETMMRELTIAVDPADIPNHLDVDVSNLHIGHSIHVSDIKVPAGVEVMDEPNAPVCLCVVPKAAAEPVAGAEGATTASEPEVIRKAKADDDAAEGADGKK